MFSAGRRDGGQETEVVTTSSSLTGAAVTRPTAACWLRSTQTHSSPSDSARPGWSCPRPGPCRTGWRAGEELDQHEDEELEEDEEELDQHEDEEEDEEDEEEGVT